MPYIPTTEMIGTLPSTGILLIIIIIIISYLYII